ncbi:hypothetical protein AB0I37_25025 [Micromonospora purpureochromogenes]|uniref:hypothetical protein n=1 Tax=Micromonospora purpureochromogenes TaxID=47872 RepID=UPI0033FC2B97
MKHRKALTHNRPTGKVYCPDCGKYGFHTRKDAKRMEKQYPEEQMRPYRCPTADDIWHLGHLPAVVRQGEMSADEWFDTAAEVAQ